jgi:iron(III) transport system permease protein
MVFLVWPIGFVFTKSFWVEGQLSLAYFQLLFSSSILMESIWNSIWLGVVITVICCLLGIPLALMMTRFDFRGKSLLQGLLLVPIVMPPFVGALGIQRIFSKYGSFNLLLMDLGILQTPIDFFGAGGFWGVVIVQALHLYPIMYLNLVAAFSNIDPSLEEAAQSMGAEKGRLFRTILLPLVRPGFFAGASIVFIWAFTDLGTPLMFNYRNTIPVQVFNMINDINENPMGFVLVVLLMVMAATFFLLSKELVGKHTYDMMARGHVTPRTTRLQGVPQGLVQTFLFGTVFVALLPHLGVIANSLAEKWVLTVLPERVSFEYFNLLAHQPLASNAIKVSLYLSCMSTLVDILLGIAVAYVLTRRKFRGMNLLDSLVMLPLAIPGVVIAFGYVATFSHTWLDPRVNPVPLLVIGYAIRRLPYMVRSAVAGFQQTPVSLEEASLSLGASPIKTGIKVTLPLITANLIAGGMLCFAFAMLEVSDSMILAMREKFFPITKAIFVLFNNLSVGMGLASAMGVVGMVILTVSILIASKVLGKKLGELFRAG